MSNLFAIRIHDDCLGTTVHGSDVLSKFLSTLGSSGYCVCRETEASRVHYQGWIRTDMKLQALRVRIKKAFPDAVGNKGYSLRVVRDFLGTEKGVGYRDYCLKGTRDALADVVAIYALDVTDEMKKEAHERYWRVCGQKRGASQGTLAERVYAWAHSVTDVTHRDIIEHTCNSIVESGKPLMFHYVRGVVNSVLFKMSSGEKDRIVDYIQSLYPQ